jgi:hypothetical protein
MAAPTNAPADHAALQRRLWALVSALGGIAERIERRRASEECPASPPEPADQGDGDQPAADAPAA